jgi:hypothetical protein
VAIMRKAATTRTLNFMAAAIRLRSRLTAD